MSSRGRVLLAMSGGVDSSVAAALLLREGYEVVGVFMRLGSPGDEIGTLTPAGGEACAAPDTDAPSRVRLGKQGCCSVGDAADARVVAGELGIPLYVMNFRREFGRIIGYFADEYARGRTPNPCVRCNDWLKFGRLHESAAQVGAQFVASGHYARIGAGPGGPSLRRGLDHAKDQSYVLFGVPRERLAHMLLPIGEMHKPMVRDLAQRLGLPVFDKPDSQEICFVPDDNYAHLVERVRPDAASEGELVDPQGRVVGRHGGHHHFTIGQRRGVGVALGYPVFVVGKDAATNRVTLGPRELLLTRGCVAGEANWLDADWAARELELRSGSTGTGDDRLPWRRCLARWRSNGRVTPAQARLLPSGQGETPSGRHGRFEVEFGEPQEAVAPGQAIVLYEHDDPDRVLGGGWIERAVPA